MSELLWTAVPGGTDASGSRLLRVLVVPKLDGGTLEGSGMATWPPQSLLQASALAVDWRVDESAPAIETRVAQADIAFHVQSGLWELFFEPATDVGSGSRKMTPHPMPEVRRTSKLAEDIETTFADPSAAPFDAGDAAPPEGYDDLVVGGLAPWRGEDKPPPPPPPLEIPKPPPPDFHRIVSLLREHPAVLRRLGLIFELRVTPPAENPGLGGAGQLRVRWPEAEATLPPIVSPWTRYGRAFLPHSESGRISAGMVTLTPDPSAPEAADAGGWKVVTVDVEGGARKLRDAAKLVDDGGEQPVRADPRLPVSLPAMRSAGLQLVRVGREEDFAQRREVALANAKRESLEDHVLDADDLVLGYRIDVKRGGGEWLSLHERIANYEKSGTAIGEPAMHEEGHAKAGGAVRESDGVLRNDEVVARWSGWSLATVRPRFDPAPGTQAPSRSGDQPAVLEFDFAPKPQSLPALRFGAQYAVRARVVDLAGGGLELDDPDADRCAIAEISYGRYQPVPSPALMLPAGLEPKDLGPAEAVDRIVVRSGPGVSFDAFDAGNPGYTTHAERRLHRPHGALELVEHHKKLDQVDDEQTFAWVQRALASADPLLGGTGLEEGPLPDPAAGGVQVVPQPAPEAPAAAFARQDWSPWPGAEKEGPKTLELRDRKPGETPLKESGSTLLIRLAPAEQLTIELSSTLTEDFFDHFTLRNEGSKGATEAGRNPLITPARAITLVHAVRRPLREPRADTRLAPREREPGQTFAILDPTPAILGPDAVDTNSTAQLEITGAWKERNDSEAHDVTGAMVQSIPIAPGETSLRDELRHEFGDTRHRVVPYSLSGASRFRQYFDPKEDPEAFIARTTLSASVNILNTALPDPPVVIGTRPSFVWKETREGTTLRRERLGGGLRVELARPWYTTGDGECLAVLLWDRTGAAPDEALQPYLTQAGRDPIWETPDPERWPIEDALSGAAEAVSHPSLVESAGAVLAVPYEPWFHNGRWYADVALPGIAAQSYCPFVRLALARYQPDSIAGHQMSTAVRTEMVQLLPERTLTVRREGNSLFVALEGLAPAGPVANRVDVVLERCVLPAGAQADSVDLTAFATADGDPPAWVAVPECSRQSGLNAAPVQIEIPPDAGAVRLRVREVELIGGAAEAKTSTPAELTERVTFTDVVVPPG